MSSKLPLISGREAIKAFQKIGYQVVRQRGSHVRMIDPTDPLHKPITVPLHRVIKPGLLRRLLRDTNLTPEAFLALTMK